MLHCGILALLISLPLSESEHSQVHLSKAGLLMTHGGISDLRSVCQPLPNQDSHRVSLPQDHD